MLLKKLIGITMFLILTMIAHGYCLGADQNGTTTKENKIDRGELINSQLNTIDFGQIQQSYKKLDGNSVLREIDFGEEVKNMASGKANIRNLFDRIKGGVKDAFTKEIRENIKIFSKLLILVLLCAILKTLQDSFSSDVGEMAFYASYILMVFLIVESFKTVMSVANIALGAMSDFMIAIFPVLITMMASSGAPTSATVYNPVVMTTVTVMNIVIKNFLLPLIFFYTVLNIINNISEKNKISNLCSLIKKSCEWSMGIMLTIFVAVMGIQGVASSSFDGVIGKTTKFAVGNFVPVVGGMLSDALDSVVSCSVLIKNSVSLVGIIVIIIMMSIPMIKLICIILMYKLSAAISQPIADNRIVNCLGDVGKSVTLVFLCLLSAAFVFIVCLAIIIAISSSGIGHV